MPDWIRWCLISFWLWILKKAETLQWQKRALVHLVRLVNSIDWILFVWQKTDNQRLLIWSKWEVLYHFGTFHRLLNFYYDSQDKQLRQKLLGVMFLISRDFEDLVWIFNQVEKTNEIFDQVIMSLIEKIDNESMVSRFVQGSDEPGSLDFFRDNPHSLTPKRFWEWMAGKYWKYRMSRPLTKYGRLTVRGYLSTRG